jgi:hypothetical protein
MNPPPLNDPRKHPRFTVDVEAAVHAADGTRVVCRTRDVSRTGICLITPTRIASGAALSIDLVLAFGNSVRSEPLHMKARVVWCTPIARAFQVGVIFDESSDQQDSFLEMFLQYLDGSISPKGVPTGTGDDEYDEEPTSPDEADDFRK